MSERRSAIKGVLARRIAGTFVGQQARLVQHMGLIAAQAISANSSVSATSCASIVAYSQGALLSGLDDAIAEATG